MKEIRAKLILNTFDGTMKKLNINPKGMESKVEFHIKYYNEEDKLTKALITFRGVIAVDFEINYFENCIGSDLCGLYEIFDNEMKISIVEKIFRNRREGFLYPGNYNYVPEDEHDILNYREETDKIIKEIDKYCLYQQQTQGGIFYILALTYELRV